MHADNIRFYVGVTFSTVYTLYENLLYNIVFYYTDAHLFIYILDSSLRISHDSTWSHQYKIEVGLPEPFVIFVLRGRFGCRVQKWKV